jgi:hypothetical protein
MSYSSYTSDSDINSGSDSESDYEDPRVRREQDPRYAILRTPDASKQIKVDLNNAPGAPWDATTNVTSLKNMEYQSAPRTTKTSLFSMKSVNRDKSIYPTPFNFKLKMPRVYKNITKFQLVQMSFPNSSNGVTGQPLFVSSLVQDMKNQGVPNNCISTCISIVNCSPASNTVAMMELHRISPFNTPLLTTVTVPDGSYNNAQLADELTFQANSTPPLNIISYPEFKDIFMNTRDISILFNEPGDTFYSKTGARINRPSKDAIMNTYYTQQHIDSLGIITEQIAFTAYYYPIMKELLASPLAEPFIQGYNDSVLRFNGMFEGLDSEYYYIICSTNQSVLDNYRPNLTFALRNVNNYSWKFNEKESRFTTMHSHLHTSIQRDIAKNYQTTVATELALASLTSASFTSLKTNAIGYCAIYKHLETNLSSVLSRYALATGYQYLGGSDHITTESIITLSTLSTDEQFNGMFQYRSTIGGIYGNYGGIIMNFRNFIDYHSTMSTYYTIVQSTNTLLNHIHQTIAMNHHMYVSTKYTHILPQNMIDTKAYTTNKGIPVSFVTGQSAYVPGIPPQISLETPSQINLETTTLLSNDENATDPLVGAYNLHRINPLDCETICCTYITSMLTKWYSGIPVNSVIGTLTYRLGLVNIVPNQYNIISTIFQYTSTGNLNFLMQINEEQGFNNMDIAMNENRAVTNDTTGQIKLFAAKILMGNVGDSGISQTLIQNPSIFENTLGKLGELHFKVFYDDQNITPAWEYLPFQYDVNEWNATFQIDEEVGFINQDPNWNGAPTVPIPTNPDQTPYLYYVPKEAK